MLLLIGTGKIAEEYIKCILDTNCKVDVVGNSLKKCLFIKDKYNIECYSGGIECFYPKKKYTAAIIATPINLLYNHISVLLDRCKNIKKILVEKPGCLYAHQLYDIIKQKKGIDIYIAYNRRFYGSIKMGKKIIKSDPIKEINLTLNEYKLKNAVELFDNNIMQNYFINMTTHVIDVAFSFIGPVKIINNSVKNFGKLKWHKRGSIFEGVCVTENNIAVNYYGNWEKDGKWKIELLLQSGKKLIYQPLENLIIVNKDNKKIIKQHTIDLKYKPGFYHQLETFLSDNKKSNLVDIETHYKNTLIYHKMCNYDYFFNVIIVGVGNIGFRHLQGLLGTKLPIKIHIVEINVDNVNKIKKYTNNSPNIFYYNDINDIQNNYIDMCVIATCSNIRLDIIKQIINNDKIKYISNIVLEKVVFQNMTQFDIFDNLIKKYQNCDVFVSSNWTSIFSINDFDKFNHPKIHISGSNWGLLCNSVHAIVYLLQNFYKDFSLSLDKKYTIFDAKRNGFKEMYGKLSNNDITIESNNKKDNFSINICDKQNTIIIEKKDEIIISSHYINNKLFSEKKYNYIHLSTYLINEYKNILLYKNTTLCTYSTAKNAHKILFNAVTHIFSNNDDIARKIPIT